MSDSSVQSAAGAFASSAAYHATVVLSVTSMPLVAEPSARLACAVALTLSPETRWVESLLICGVVVTRSRLYSPAAVTLSGDTHSTVLSRAFAVTLILLPTSASVRVRLPSVVSMPSVSSVQSASPSPLAYHAMVRSASSGTSLVEPDQLPGTGTCTLGVIFEPTLSVTFLSASSMPASLYWPLSVTGPSGAIGCVPLYELFFCVLKTVFSLVTFTRRYLPA